MPQEEAYEKISPTAKLVAHVRTLTDIPFAKDIASASGAEKDFQTIAGTSAESMSQFAFLWEARYKATDRIMAQYGVSQVLEIAAGLSPRGLAMTESPDVVYVATDLPQILEEEEAIARSILAKLHIRRPNLHFTVANALDRASLLHAATPFQLGKPVAVITEGLFFYLTRDEQETLAGNIRDLLALHGGLWISPDVTAKQPVKLFSEKYDTMRQWIQHIAGATGRDIEGDAFEDENEVRQFFTAVGFAIEEFPHSNVLEYLSSVKLAKLSREEIVAILRTIKTLILTIR